MASLETPTTCPRHPRVQTNLRCASCETLICPRCLVQTPVGAKCRTCATNRGGSLSALSPVQALALVAVSLLAGAIAGVGAAINIGFFFTFLLAFVYGGFAGSMILKACQRRCGRRVEAIAGVCMGIGALAGKVLAVMAFTGGRLPGGLPGALEGLFLPVPIEAIAIAIAVAAAVTRIRYV